MHPSTTLIVATATATLAHAATSPSKQNGLQFNHLNSHPRDFHIAQPSVEDANHDSTRGQPTIVTPRINQVSERVNAVDIETATAVRGGEKKTAREVEPVDGVDDFAAKNREEDEVRSESESRKRVKRCKNITCPESWVCVIL